MKLKIHDFKMISEVQKILLNKLKGYLMQNNNKKHFLFKKQNIWDIVDFWQIWWFWEFLRIINHRFWSPLTDLVKIAEG